MPTNRNNGVSHVTSCVTKQYQALVSNATIQRVYTVFKFVRTLAVVPYGRTTVLVVPKTTWYRYTALKMSVALERPVYTAERQHLRSAICHLLVVPWFHLDMHGRRTFAVAGPKTWNLFRNNLHDMQIDCFHCTLKKTFLFEQYSGLGTSSALEVLFFL